MKNLWFGPIVSYDGALVIGDPDDQHVTLTEQSLSGLDDERGQISWEEVQELTLQARTSPRPFSKAIEYFATSVAAAGLDFGWPPAAQMYLHMKAGTANSEDYLLVTMRGRFRLTSQELRTVNKFLQWITEDSEHRKTLASPDQLILKLQQSTQ